MVKTAIEPEDEWLHSFYYFNDEAPKIEDFEKTISDHLTFEFNIISRGLEYIFQEENKEGRSNQLESLEKISKLSEKAWDEFYLKDIFTEIQRGKRLKKGDHILGKTPYVSSTAMNNGVDGFVGNKEKIREFSNCLSLANSGSVGATFYQPFIFVASDHVTKLKNNNFSKYIYLFIATIISRLSEKYSFNREINDPRIQREKIVLPIKQDGTPDYEYMESFMIRIEKQIITRYLKRKTAYNIV